MPAADRNTDLDRLACLQAMGLTLYSSRRDLPGAAPSRRVLVPAAFTAAPSPAAAPAAASSAGPGTKTARGGSPGSLARSLDAPKSRPAPRTGAPEPVAVRGGDTVRFRLAAVVAGGALWLEELGDAPLAREQVALVRAMVRACGWATDAPPRVQEFAWPLHQNPQLEQGAAAAAAALQAFLARLVGEAGLGRILLLGSSARELAGQLTLPVPVASLPSTHSMLAGGAAKREAWLVLRELAQS